MSFSTRLGRPTRRQVLTGGAVAATAGLSSRFGRLVERAYAAEPTKCAPLSDIEHVVFVMQENRSFDHYFGTYRGVRGFDDPRVLHQPDGKSVFFQRGYQPGKGPDKNGYLPPWHLDTKNLSAYAECVDDITHNWQPQHVARNNGRMNQWVLEHLANDGNSIGPLTMGYYERSDLTLYHALADTFTLCDGYFCSVIGPTDPNRVMWFSATIDPDGKHGGPVLETLVSNRDSQFGRFSWKTMPEVLQEAGVSWRVYQDASDLTLLNPLPYFKVYNEVGTPFYENAFGVYSLGTPVAPGRFQADILTGQLPAVSWLFPSFESCEHPSAPPALGENFIANVLQSLLANPAVWEKTAMFVMYDENGGFFDHVPPPVAPPGTPGEFLTMDKLPADAQGVRGPVGLGFRVPMMVISPYSRGGLVYSGVNDHTSQLKFLETRFGTEVPNLSAWRRKTVGDLTGAFNFAAKPITAAPSLPLPPSPEDASIVEQCTFNGATGVEDAGIASPVPAVVVKPHQEKGHAARPSGLTCGHTAAEHRGASAAPVSDATGSGNGALAKTGGNQGIAAAALGLTGLAAVVYRLRTRRDHP